MLSTRVTTCLCAVVLILIPGWARAAPDRGDPNILLILADDLGYGSLGCYGASHSVVRTPHLDRLAERGVRFTDASTPSSVCSPTRYGMLMGRYPWRTRLKAGVVNVFDPLLPDPKRVSLASWLKGRGYRTAAIGKWHLGYGSRRMQAEDFTDVLRPGPLEMGFTYHFGVPQNHGDMTGIYIENDRIYGLESDRVFPYSRSFYGKRFLGFDAPQRIDNQVMDTLTDQAVNWLADQEAQEPFFLYFAPVAVHHPITPSDPMRGESGCGPYGDFIQDLDHSVGRLIRAVEERGALDHTLVLFTSDNGGELPKDPSSPELQAAALGLQANGALRGDKHTIWEGGVRVPLIAAWPGQIPANRVCTSMVNLVDLMASVIDLVDGSPPPPDRAAAPDSFSFAEALWHPGEPGGSTRSSMVTANVHGILAIRQGPWKYIEGQGASRGPGNRTPKAPPSEARPQLYRLDTDPAEQHDVIGKHPEVAQRLQQELDAVREKDPALL